jgi:outer membrane protein assembly factor BamB
MQIAVIELLMSGVMLVAMASDARAAEEPLFLGQPLAHWIAAASQAETPEAAATTVAALALAVEAEDPATKVAAADALTILGPKALTAAPALMKQFEDVRPWVRVSSSAALAAMGEAVVPALTDCFRKATPAVKGRVASALGAIGPRATAALPVLEEALAQASGGLVDQLRGALEQIAPEKYPPTTARRRAQFDETGAERGESRAAAAAGDWPQFHGPLRDGICREKGLLSRWPAEGPKPLWQLDGLGTGYSSVSIVGDRLFTMGDRPDQDGTRSQFVIAYDLASRQQAWAVRVGPPHEDGPRCTPTVDRGLVFALGTDGDLVCLDVDTGRIRWRRHLVKEFGGKMMTGWRFSESPLVDGERVFCTPGGKDCALVALDRTTGQTIWKSVVPDLGPLGLDGAAYASANTCEIAGVRQYVQLLGRGVISVEAETGRFLWGYNGIANTTANIPSPIVHGNYVFCTTGYNAGSALLKITRDGDAFRADEVYTLTGKDFQNHHGGCVLVDGYVYGGHGMNRGDMACVELSTGKVMWKQRAPSFGSASIVYADGHLIFRYDRGEVFLVAADPQACRISGRFQAPTGDGPAWAHPVIHGGRLYLRHADKLVCYDLRNGA